MHFKPCYFLATLTTGLLIAALPHPALGQGYYYEAQAAPSLQGHFMGGYSGTSGNTAKYLQGGWVIDGGFTWWLHNGEGLGVRTDLSYSEHAATDQFLSFGQAVTGEEVDDGWGSFSSVSTGLVYRAPIGGRIHLYGLAQVGFSHAQLRLVQTFFVPGVYCDPFFGYCDYPEVGAASVYSYSTDRVSWNVGVGLDLPVRGSQSWFVEAQYRRIEAAPHAFEYWPIMVGMRF